jgi:hypothetical protein
MNVLPASWILVLLAGCSLGAEEPHWSDQLIPSGPCWEVNLVDGLDEESTNELHNLYACLNRTGNLQALSAIDAAMDTPNREGTAIGLSFAQMSNSLPRSGFDLFGMAGKALALFTEFNDDIDVALEALVELNYGEPYEVVEAEFETSSSLESGITVPAVRLLSETAGVILDQGDGVQAAMGLALELPLLHNGLCSLAGVVHTEDPTLAPVADNLIGNLADAWVEAGNDENDLWENGSGHSIRDLVDAIQFGKEDGFFNETEDDLRTLLNDPRIQMATKGVLVDAVNDGEIGPLANQILYLATVDSGGVPLTYASAEDTSALQAGLRLLDSANDDMSCTVPIIGFTIDLGNMSVAILRQIANLSRGAAVTRVAFLGDVLGFGITQTVANQLAASGACPLLDEQLLDDLRVVERLNDSEVGDLVAIIHGLLDAVYESGERDRLQETVNVLGALHAHGLTQPIEEALRDLAPSALVADIGVLVGTLVDPSSLHVDACPTGSEPLDFDTLWDTSETFLAESDFIDTLGPVIESALGNDATWQMIDNGAALASHPTARIHALPELAVALNATDSEGDLLGVIVDTVQDPALFRPVLAAIETPELRDAIIQATPDSEGPLPFITRLIISDTVTVMLQTVDLVLDSLGATEDTSD